MGIHNTLRTSCQKATELIERRELRPLNGTERLGLWLHLRVCKACRTYQAQSAVIDRLLEKRPHDRETSVIELEERILKNIS
jgi:hypothetical protein